MTNQGPHAADTDEADDALMTGGEVAALMRVHPKTVARWGDSGLITVLRTPGGHRRYLAGEVEALRRPVVDEDIAGEAVA